MKCPFRLFKKCPQNNSDNGCALWVKYIGNKGTMEASLEHCAFVLNTHLALESINTIGKLAGEVNKLGAEVSALRSENIKEQQASRLQLVALAQGNKKYINANHANNKEIK